MTQKPHRRWESVGQKEDSSGTYYLHSNSLLLRCGVFPSSRPRFMNSQISVFSEQVTQYLLIRWLWPAGNRYRAAVIEHTEAPQRVYAEATQVQEEEEGSWKFPKGQLITKFFANTMASNFTQFPLAKFNASTCKCREFSKGAADCLAHKMCPTSLHHFWQRATGGKKKKSFLANLPARWLHHILTNNPHSFHAFFLIKYVHTQCPTQASWCSLIIGEKNDSHTCRALPKVAKVMAMGNAGVLLKVICCMSLCVCVKVSVVIYKHKCVANISISTMDKGYNPILK